MTDEDDSTFKRSVDREFQFLTSQGFHCVETSPSRVKFEAEP